MNTNAANALLKALEEPPANATLLLVSHQPSRLLPTIRSRCRDLRLSALGADDFAAALAQAGVDGDPATLAELSGGSVGQAVELALGGGAEIYAEMVALFATLPRMDRARALRLAESMTGKGNETRFALFLRPVRSVHGRARRAQASWGQGQKRWKAKRPFWRALRRTNRPRKGLPNSPPRCRPAQGMAAR